MACFNCKSKGHIASNCRLNNNCFTCKESGHKRKDCFKNAKCNVCHKIGHTGNVCRAKSTNAVLSLNNSGNNLNYVDAKFDNMSIKMLVDTGAIISVISNQFVTDRSLTNHLEECNKRAVIADGRSVKINNFLRGILTVNNFSKEVCLYVVDTCVDAIMGMDVIPEIGLRVGSDQGLIFSVLPEPVKFKHIFDRPLNDSSLKNDIKAKLKTKVNFDRRAENKLYVPGQRVLVKRVFGPKFACKGEECIVVKQLNFDTVLLKNTADRVFSCSSSRISPIAHHNNIESNNGTLQATENTWPVLDPAPNLRRSKRVRFSPDRFVNH